MPRTPLTKTTTSRVGVAPVYDAMDQVNGMTVDNTDQKGILEVANTDTIPHTVTISTPIQVDTLDVEERTVIVPATTGRVVIGPFLNSQYATAGIINIDVEDATGMTAAWIVPGSLT